MSIQSLEHTRVTGDRLLLALVPRCDAGDATRILAPEGRFTFGSDRTCDVHLPVAGVGAYHCQVTCKDGVATVIPAPHEVLFVNELAVTAARSLEHGDILQIGNAEFRVEFRSESLFRRPGTSSGAGINRARHSGSHPVRHSLPPGRTFSRQESSRLSDIELRMAEVDRRFESLAEQNSQFLQRQSLFEKRAAEIESRQKEAFQHLEIRRELVSENEEALAAERASIAELAGQLKQEREELRRLRIDVDERRREADACLQHERDELAEQVERFEKERRAFELAVAEEAEAADQRQAERRHLIALRQEIDALRAEDESVRETLAAAITDREVSLAFTERSVSEQLRELDSERADLQSVRQNMLAELAAERESLEAESQQKRAELLDAETEVDQKLSEVQARLAELTDREAALTDLSERETQIANREAELAAAGTALDNDRKSLEAHLQELTAASEKLNQDQAAHASNVAVWAKKSAAHETDFADREATLNELQTQLQTQAQQLSARADELNALPPAALNASADTKEREAELTAWANELEQRQNEVARRVSDLKRLRDELNRASQENPPRTGASASVAESHQSSIELEESRRQVEQLQAERNELSTALTELRAAFEAVREELIAKHDSDPESGSETDDIRQQLLSKDMELAAVNEALEGKAAEVRKLESRLQSVLLDFEEEKARFDDDRRSLASAPSNSSVNEETLLFQIESLKAELADAAAPDDRPSDGFRANPEQYEEVIRDLKQQIEEMQMHRDKEPADSDSAEHLELIAELKQRLESREQKIQELQQVTSVPSDDADASDGETLRTLHRELDSRTVLLDTREEELRERTRMVEQSETEVEKQRRELLEARQQLELARAEIQVAMDQSRTQTSEPNLDALLETAPQRTEATTDESESDESEPKVRSELAELFGINSTDSSAAAAPTKTTSLPAVDDYSQEAEAAVPMSFSAAENVLLEAPAREAAEEPSEEKEDEFVAKYMEQLLARNREKAGTALPEELTNVATKKNEEVKQESQGPKSFIDAYLSGEYGEGDSSVTAETSTLPAAGSTPDERAPRQKIDLDALRNDMNSFRQLSTKSVENALASHAKRQNRGGITTRTTVLTVLIMVCLFLLGAAALDVIAFGATVWVSIIAVIVSGGELTWKVWRINKSVRQTSDGLSVDRTTMNSSPVSTADMVPPQADGALVSVGPSDDHNSQASLSNDSMESEFGLREDNDTPGVSRPAGENPNQEEDQYFEL